MQPIIPVLERNGMPWTPTLSGFVLAPTSLSQEEEVFGPRLELAARYIEQNDINVEVVSSPTVMMRRALSAHLSSV